MLLFYFSMCLAILANLFYHLSQKSITKDIHPIVSMIVTYAVALLIALVVLPFYPARLHFAEVKKLNWASFVLGVAIVGLELGFLLAYRAGWQMNVGALVANVTVALLLIPIGIYFFSERISLVQTIGIVLCILGLVLVNYRS